MTSAYTPGSFSTAYTSGKEVCSAEEMIPWFCRGFRTYLPSKRAKYGMNATKLCKDSGNTFGYVQSNYNTCLA